LSVHKGSPLESRWVPSNPSVLKNQEVFGRTLRSQLELYIVAQLGSEYLVSKKSQTELRVSKEIADLRKKLAALEARKTALEREIKT
jgi:cell division protein FtsB